MKLVSRPTGTEILDSDGDQDTTFTEDGSGEKITVQVVLERSCVTRQSMKQSRTRNCIHVCEENEEEKKKWP